MLLDPEADGLASDPWPQVVTVDRALWLCRCVVCPGVPNGLRLPVREINRPPPGLTLESAFDIGDGQRERPAICAPGTQTPLWEVGSSLLVSPTSFISGCFHHDEPAPPSPLMAVLQGATSISRRLEARLPQIWPGLRFPGPLGRLGGDLGPGHLWLQFLVALLPLKSARLACRHRRHYVTL